MKRICLVILVNLLMLTACQSVQPTPSPIIVERTVIVTAVPATAPNPSPSTAPTGTATTVPTQMVRAATATSTLDFAPPTLAIPPGSTPLPTATATLIAVTCSRNPQDRGSVGLTFVNYIGGTSPLVLLIDGKQKQEIESIKVEGGVAHSFCIDLGPGRHTWMANHALGRSAVFGSVDVILGNPLPPITFCLGEIGLIAGCIGPEPPKVPAPALTATPAV